VRERTTPAPDSGEMVQEGTPEEEELGAYQRVGFSLRRKDSHRERGRSCPPGSPPSSLIKYTLHRPARCIGAARYPSAVSDQRLDAASDFVSPDADESTHLASGVRPLPPIERIFIQELDPVVGKGEIPTIFLCAIAGATARGRPRRL
jgi:hypothetical protein